MLHAAALLSTLLTAACAGNIVGDLGSTPNADQSGNADGGGGVSPPTTPTQPSDPTQPAPPEAIVVTPAQLGYCGSSSGSGSSGSSGAACNGWAPGTLFIEFGSPAPTCGDPTLADTTCGTFGASLSIPPGELTVGNVSSLGLGSFFSFMSPGSAGDCGGGGGTFEAGTLTIVDVSSSSVTFTLSGTNTPGLSNDVDGTYVAEICP